METRPASAEFDPNRGLSVHLNAFDAQIRFIAAHCEPLSLPEAVHRLRARRLSRRAVIVTFDDGYADNLTLALPVLRRYQVPATIYVTTAGPDREPFLWWYELERLMAALPVGSVEFKGTEFAWRDAAEQMRCFQHLNSMMKASRAKEQQALLARLRGVAGAGDDASVGEMLTWDQVRELDADPLITIGCHTTRHRPMARLTDAELRSDLQASKARLEAQLDHPVEHFAYPYGRRAEAGTREFAAVRDAGFESAVTTRTGHWMRAHSRHLHALPRITVTWFDSLEDFRLKLYGARASWVNRGWRVVTN